jgi:formamidopyrimidine-DNA glycosylase
MKPELLVETSPQGLGRRLKNHEFTGIRRHGKYLFARVGSECGWLVMHFGMTGDLAYYSENDPAPENEAVKFDFSNRAHLAYISQRLLGHLEWTDQVDDYVNRKELGPDALDEELTANAFIKLISEHRGRLKTGLMNQSIIAGIGNILSDELLFQCGLRPEIGIPELTDEDLGRLFRTMKRVLKTEVRAESVTCGLPDSYLGPHRNEDGRCPKCGTKLLKTKVSGRSCYYCPNCQK